MTMNFEKGLGLQSLVLGLPFHADLVTTALASMLSIRPSFPERALIWLVSPSTMRDITETKLSRNGRPWRARMMSAYWEITAFTCGATARSLTSTVTVPILFSISATFGLGDCLNYGRKNTKKVELIFLYLLT